jgi:hypothetical protein
LTRSPSVSGAAQKLPWADLRLRHVLPAEIALPQQRAHRQLTDRDEDGRAFQRGLRHLRRLRRHPVEPHEGHAEAGEDEDDA